MCSDVLTRNQLCPACSLWPRLWAASAPWRACTGVSAALYSYVVFPVAACSLVNSLAAAAYSLANPVVASADGLAFARQQSGQLLLTVAFKMHALPLFRSCRLRWLWRDPEEGVLCWVGSSIVAWHAVCRPGVPLCSAILHALLCCPCVMLHPVSLLHLAADAGSAHVHAGGGLGSGLRCG